MQAEAVNPQSLGMLAQLMHQTEQAETSEAACIPAWLHGMTVSLPHPKRLPHMLRLKLPLACQASLAGITEAL